MIKSVKYWCIALMSVGMLSQAANAVVISITPSSQVVDIGETASVDVSISDFEINQALGEFDFEFLFNSAILSLDNIIFGTELGFSFQDDGEILPGLYGILEGSLESAQFLIDNQADSFLLFTMEFTAMNFGVSDVEVDFSLLGDQDGLEILYDDFSPVSIRVRDPNPNPASEPAHLAILLMGLGLITWRRRLNS